MKQQDPSSPTRKTPSSTSPTDLLKTLDLAGPKGQHAVEGKVMDAYLKDPHVILTVHGEANTIKIRTRTQGLKLGTRIRASGTVWVNIPKNVTTSGYEVLLDADQLEILELPRFVQASEIRSKAGVTLEAFVLQHNSYPLHWICTEVGFRDAFKEFSKRYPNAKPFKSSITSMTDPAKVLEAIKDAVKGGAKGIVLTRGGGDRSGFLLWDDADFVRQMLEFDVPIYTALGHEKDTFLADRVADESFSTPTAVGSALARAVDRRRASERADRPGNKPSSKSPKTVNNGLPDSVKWIGVAIGILVVMQWCSNLRH